MAPEIAAAVNRMSSTERRTLAREILDTVADDDFPMTDAVRAELTRRLADFDAELDHAAPWDSVKMELRTKHGW